MRRNDEPNSLAVVTSYSVGFKARRPELTASLQG